MFRSKWTKKSESIAARTVVYPGRRAQCPWRVGSSVSLDLNVEMVVVSVHGRLIVDGSPVLVSGERGGAVYPDLLEEQDVWFWLVDFVMLPAQALRLCQP
jgi:hypothetical protein